MSNKQDRQGDAVHQAASLSRIAMKLQRAPADQVTKLLRDANRCLQLYKMAKRLVAEKPSGTIDETVAEDLEAPMQSLAEVIRETVAPYGFALLVFSLDDDSGDRMNYVSNAMRDDICVAMRQFIAAHEERLFDGPETKQ